MRFSPLVRAVFVLVTTVVLFQTLLIGGLGSSVGGTPDTAGDRAGDVEIEDELLEDETERNVTVVVRLTEADRPEPSDVSAERAAESAMEMRQEHASTTQSKIERFAENHDGVTIENQFWITNAVVVTVDTDEVPLARIGQIDDVERLHANFEVETESGVASAAPVSATGDTADTSSVETTYGLDQINAPDAWEEYDTKGEGIRVAVIDTGVDADHDDIDLYTEDESDETYPGGWAEFDNTGDKIEDSTPHDDDGHGTHVSGTVAGGDASGQHIGVAPEVELIHGMGLPEGSGSFSQITAAIEWAVENDADVVSMSFGVDGYWTRFTDPIRNAEDAGVTVTASTGNDGEEESTTPGSEYDSLSAGATDSDLEIPAYSSGDLIDTEDAWGDDAPDDWPDEYIVPSVVAPGVSVESAEPGGGYRSASGTSMAAPHVAGSVALIQSATDERKSSDDIKEALEETAWKPDDWDEEDAEWHLETDYGTVDSRYGHGIIDAKAAIAYLKDDDPEPDFEITDADLDPETILEGESTTVTATVENAGDADGTFTAGLREDGAVVEIEDVEVDADATADVTFERSYDEAGTYDLAVNETDAGELTVEEPEPDFAVTDADLETETILEGADAEVTATVENDGDAAGEFEAAFTVTDGDDETETLDEETVELDPGESETLTLSGSVDDPGTYDAEVSDESAGELTVERPATFELSDGDLDESEIEDGESVEVTAEVENLGDREGTFEAELHVDGDVEDTTDVEVAGDESETVTFTYEPDAAGEYSIAVEGADGDGDRTTTTAGHLTVLEPATFEVTDATLEDAEVFEGDRAAATATVANVGEAEGTFTVELTADDGSGAEARNGTDVTLDGGDATQVRLSDAFETAGEYAIGIGDEPAGELAVVEPEPATFEASDVSLDPETILEDEPVTIDAGIENVGDEAGEHTATLHVDGEEAATEGLSLDGGESTTVSFEETFADAGEYGITVDDATPVTLTVDRPATFEVHDPDLNESTVLEDETVQLAAEVENVGDREGDYEAEFRADGEVVDEQGVTLAPGETEPVTLEATFPDAGEYDVSLGDADVGTLTVETPADLEVTGAGLDPETILENESVDVDAVIENHGDREGTLTAELQVDDEAVDSTTVTLAGGETTTETFTESFAHAGTYGIAVDGTDAGQLTVDRPATFAVTDADLDDTEIAAGDSAGVTATIENAGDREGSFEAELLVDGEGWETTSVEIDAGDEGTVHFDPTFEDAGEYAVAVSGEPAGDITVVEPEPAAFETRDVSLGETPILEGEPVTIDAEIENVGDETGEHTATLSVDGDDRTSTTVALDGGESTTVSFTETFDEADSYEVTVDDAVPETLTVDRPATLEVTGADLTDEEILEGESAGVTAEAENVGDREGSFDVSLTADGEHVGSQEVTLDAGETGTVTVEEPFTDPGTYDLAVDGTHAGQLTVEAADSEFDTADVTLDEPAIVEGESVTVEATVENVGDAEGDHAATLSVDGEFVETESVTLSPGESTAVSFTETFADAGEYDIAVDDADPRTLTVDRPAVFALAGGSLDDAEIEDGESVEVTAEAENVGDREGTLSAELQADGEREGTADVTLDAGERDTVSITYEPGSAGEYQITVAGDDGDGDRTTTTAGTLTVLEPAAFATADAAIDESEILEGDSVEVTATVENEGEVEGTHEATLRIDGETANSTEVTLDGGDTEDVEFEHTFEEAGEYELAVDGAHAGEVTVEEPEPVFELPEGALTETTILEGDTAEATATVENTGTADGEFEVEFTATDEDGDVETLEVETVALEPGETESVTLSGTVDDAGTYDAAVNGESVGELTVERPAVFELAEGSLTETTITTDGTTTVEATVENVGDREGTFTAELLIDDAEETTTDLTLDGGESTDVEFTVDPDDAGLDPGTYDVEVAGDDGEDGTTETDAGTLTVEAEDDDSDDSDSGGGGGGLGGGLGGGSSADDDEEDGSIEVVDATTNATTVQVGEPVRIDATVENDRGYPGRTDLALERNGGTVETSSTPVLEDGESTTVAFVYTPESAGEYAFAVDGTDAGQLTVENRTDDGGDAADEDGDDATGDDEDDATDGDGGADDGADPTDGESDDGADDGTGGADDREGVDLRVDDDRTSVEVTEAVDSVDVPVAGDADRTGLSTLAIDVGEGVGEFALEVSEPAAEELRAPEPDGHRALGYVRVETDADAVEGATFEFDVPDSELPDGAIPADVTLLRYADGDWQELPTEVRGDGGYTASSPGFSEFAIVVDGGPAAIAPVDASLATDAVDAGEAVAVTATVENAGGEAGTEELSLLAGGEELATETVALDPGESATVTLSATIDDPGSHGLAVATDGEPVEAGTVTVAAAGGIGPIPGWATTPLALLVAGLTLGVLAVGARATDVPVRSLPGRLREVPVRSLPGRLREVPVRSVLGTVREAVDSRVRSDGPADADGPRAGGTGTPDRWSTTAADDADVQEFVWVEEEVPTADERTHGAADDAEPVSEDAEPGPEDAEPGPEDAEPVPKDVVSDD